MHLKYLNVLKYDLIHGNKEKKSLQFFRNSDISVIIWFTILEYFFLNKELNLEILFDEVCTLRKTSKPTISKIIDNAVSMSLVIKEKSSEDKRLSILKPTDLTINEFKEWSDDLFNLNSLKLQKYNNY